MTGDVTFHWAIWPLVSENPIGHWMLLSTNADVQIKPRGRICTIKLLEACKQIADKKQIQTSSATPQLFRFLQF